MKKAKCVIGVIMLAVLMTIPLLGNTMEITAHAQQPEERWQTLDEIRQIRVGRVFIKRGDRFLSIRPSTPQHISTITGDYMGVYTNAERFVLLPGDQLVYVWDIRITLDLLESQGFTARYPHNSLMWPFQFQLWPDAVDYFAQSNLARGRPYTSINGSDVVQNSPNFRLAHTGPFDTRHMLVGERNQNFVLGR